MLKGSDKIHSLIHISNQTGSIVTRTIPRKETRTRYLFLSYYLTMSRNSDQCSKSRGFKKGIKLWNEKLLFGHNDYVMANSKSKTLLGKRKVQ